MGRPPTVTSLFPNSKALIVSGKVIDRAMRAKGKAIAMAANGRNSFVIRGALRAAQKANAALIIEIAKSEGGQKAYCPVNYWNMARIVDSLCNEMGITIPVAVHADHYGIKNDADLAQAMVEVPTMFEAGITSIAIDASHQPNDQNLLANLAVNPAHPGVGRPRDRSRRDQGLLRALHARRGAVPHPGAQRARRRSPTGSR